MIVQKVREAERLQIAEQYKDRIGDLLSGSVKTTRDNVIVDLEAMLKQCFLEIN